MCHLDNGAEIRMELTVNTGKGYVPASATAPKTRRSGSSRSIAFIRR